MAKPDTPTRQRLLEAAYDLFYREGFARVGVDAVAEAAGVTKRTLYYHFDSKDALLAGVLAHQHEMALKQIEDWTGANADDPAAMMGELFAQLERWARRPKWRGPGFTRLAMELAGLPGHPARTAAKRHKAAVESWLARRFAAAGVREPGTLAAQMTVLMEGCMALTLIHGDARYIASAAAAARSLLRNAGACEREP
jgi:AcrR family transcriptional regulator